ncbi:MAG TPA: hypothetical protein VMA95_14765 [Streptosporangiaceae bacterium]|nr:hypothetical protein [Streptosporangiaceae bacterium]
MSQAEEEVHAPSPGSAVVPLGQVQRADDWADLRKTIRLIQRNRPVLIIAIVMVLAQVAWRAQFLSHLYFLRTDYFNYDYALESHLGWGYLTYPDSGQLVIGQRAVIWILARISFYNWDLAMAVTLAFTLAAGLAAAKMLRTLFGERRVILLLLAIYLLIPVTMASLGWLNDALVSIPLQLATFMAVDAQVSYVRAGRRKDFAAAVCWLIAGLIFSEKALVLPLLLFAVSAFIEPGGSWFASARSVLIRCMRLWAAYGVAFFVYLIVLLTASEGQVPPQAPVSAHSFFTFGWDLVRQTLLPSAVGGPWRWFPLAGNWYSLAAAQSEFQWIALVVAIAVVGISIWRRNAAWGAWAIFAGWLILADIVLVIASKLIAYPALSALDTNYVADAAPVLVLCLGLAFLPLSEPHGTAVAGTEVALPSSRAHRLAADQAWRSAAAALFTVFLIGSIWSAQDYSSLTTGSPAAIYVAFAKAEIAQAQSGQPVLDTAVPPDVSYQASDNGTARVIGDAVPGRVRWIEKPDGTIDNLRELASNGLLEPVWVYGTSSGKGHVRGCWPETDGAVTVSFPKPSPYLTTLARIGYIWGSSASGTVQVQFGNVTRSLVLEPGLHTAYVTVSGSAATMSVSGISGGTLCVGDVEAGNPEPVTAGHTIARS